MDARLSQVRNSAETCVDGTSSAVFTMSVAVGWRRRGRTHNQAEGAATMRAFLLWLIGALAWSACSTLPIQETAAPPMLSSHPLGYTLPPDAPQLYDNEVYGRFQHVARRPYQVHGVKLAPWLLVNILDEAVYGDAMGREITESV